MPARGRSLLCSRARSGAGALTIDNFEEGDFSVGPQPSGPPAEAEQTGLDPANVVGVPERACSPSRTG